MTRFQAVSAKSCLVLVCLTASSASAEDRICYVDKFRISNNGAYSLSLYTGYKPIDGNKDQVRVNNNNSDGEKGLSSGQSTTYAISNHTNDKIQEGDEVWPILRIDMGEKNSCRKDGFRMIYSTTQGRTMSYKSGGTTQNNNRCKYDGHISEDCYSGN